MKIGDVVETGVWVLGEFTPIYVGTIIGTVSGLFQVDVGSMHGCAPWIRLNQENDLRLVQKD